MSAKTLYVAWRNRIEEYDTSGWFPIGRLDADIDGSDYCFRYIKGADRAHEEADFPMLMEFPYRQKKYQSSELFPIFKNRVMSPKRPDFVEYMCNLGLDETADPMQILSVSGGRRVTDAYEVFPKIEKREDGSFTCRFLLHGSRYLNPKAQDRIDELKQGEELCAEVERNNPASGVAVQIHTTDCQQIGWTPRYLAADLTAAIDETAEYSAHVVRINPSPTPSSHRVLIQMSGRWDKYEPMSGDDFKPLVD